METNERVTALEKEVADLKRQLEDRPEQIRTEIESFFKGMTFNQLDSLVKGK